MRFATILAGSLAFVLGTGTPSSTGDANDGHAQYGRLLAEKNELHRLRQQRPGDIKVQTQLRHLEADFKSFLRDHPQHVGAMVTYGGMLYDDHQEEAAVKWWHKAVATPSDRATDVTAHAHAYNDLGQHYGENGKAADALRYHQKAVELAPQEPMFHFNWATTCSLFRAETHQVYGWEIGEIQQRSLDQYRQARELAPEDFMFGRGYAEALYLTPGRDWNEVYNAWKFCLEQKLEELQRQHVFGQMALSCIHLERYDEARKWLLKIDDQHYLPLRNALARKIGKLQAAKSTP